MTFLKASKGTLDDKLEYLMDQWVIINKKYFKSKLPKPYMRWLKDTGIKMNRRGQYSHGTNTFAFSRYLFGAGEAKVIEILKHEMSHQAVRKYDKVTRGEIHGDLFRKWCVHMGIQPIGHDDTKTIEYLPSEKKTRLLDYIDKEKAKSNERKEKQEEFKPLSSWSIKDNTPAQYYSADDKKWVKGLIVCKNDQAGVRMAFIERPYSSGYMNVPTTWFREMPAKEKAKYLGKDFINAADEIRSNLAKKKARKSEMKSLKSIFGGW